MLFSITVVWGGTFAIVKMTLLRIPVFWFLFMRFILAFTFFIPLLRKKAFMVDRATLKAGTVLGSVLFLAYAF
ncbi:MAG: hypothetical protein QMD53_07185 [Actinomycetota bacterium]|nr:hypothetical protein [Actinomycetota bacterium]